MEVPTLTSEQLFFIELLVGVLSIVITQGIKIALAYFGVKIGKAPVTYLLFAVSLGLGFWWIKPAISPFPIPSEDPALFIPALFAWLANIVQVGAFLVGFAVTIYNTIAAKIFDKLGWGSEKVEQNYLDSFSANEDLD